MIRQDLIKLYRRSYFTSALAAALMVTIGAARAAEAAKYPDWSGQWERFVVRGLPGQPSHDQTKPWGFGQEAPLTSESTAILEASIEDRRKAGKAII